VLLLETAARNLNEFYSAKAEEAAQ
jgi:hypothetical protein